MPKDYLVLDRSGDKMPLVGFGTWKITDEQAEDTIYQAIKAGNRLIDTAAVYGNERGVGRAITKAIQDGTVTRKEMFGKILSAYISEMMATQVVTKLWNAYHHKDNVRPAFNKQLRSLGLDYVDLYHIHWPIPTRKTKAYDTYPPPGFSASNGVMETERSSLHDCYRELEKLVDDGLVRNIGISNFNVQLTLDLLTYCRIKPAVLQIELHPYLQQKRLVHWVQSQGIQVTAYSSFGPAAFDNVTAQGKQLGPLLEHDKIKQIADKHGKTTGQVLLRWSVERPVAVIPKSASPDRMKSNHDLFSWSLDDEDRKVINGMNVNFRFNDLAQDVYGFELPLFD
ncbi:xylose reductase [Zychaea mexicana]|uniref:xylose reductase n=1 Tax=Zychaea mexicana TaxID=64656 RepID=UPI0022FEFD24|nr:xylose reductase [Zychaea mexicana]KAI9498433.1 xylose reductase [Zychaea mexicana]